MNAGFQTLPSSPISPLMLADRLISLAQDADRAGYSDAASRLVGLVYSVLDGSHVLRH